MDQCPWAAPVSTAFSCNLQFSCDFLHSIRDHSISFPFHPWLILLCVVGTVIVPCPPPPHQSSTPRPESPPSPHPPPRQPPPCWQPRNATAHPGLRSHLRRGRPPGWVDGGPSHQTKIKTTWLGPLPGGGAASALLSSEQLVTPCGGWPCAARPKLLRSA